MRQRLSDNEHGFVLLVALFVVSIVMMHVTIGLTRTASEVLAARGNAVKMQTFHLAEGALDDAVAAVSAQIRDHGQFPANLGAVPALAAPGFACGAPVVAYVGPQTEVAVPDVPALRPFKGMRAVRQEVSIQVDVRNADGPGVLPAPITRTRLREQVAFHLIPIFQFAMWDRDDLLFRPGPPMNIQGAVFANGNLQLEPWNVLHIDGTVTAAGDIIHPSSSPNADVLINDGTGTYVGLKNANGSWLQSTSSNWATQSAARWHGKVTARAPRMELPMPRDASGQPLDPHVIIEAPQAGDSAAVRNAKLYNKAGLRIMDGVATDAGGHTVVLPSNVLGPGQPVFFEPREDSTIRVLQIDVGALRDSGLAPQNGILYVGSVHNSYDAVRLVNGGQLPAQGLTIATHEPLYVRGNYNYDPAHPSVKQRAALIADAVTMLSPGWVDQSTRTAAGVTSSRRAQDMTVRAGIMAGRVRDSSSEHMIRFLEDWSGKTFTFVGSEVSPWESTDPQQRALRCCGDTGGGVYQPPNRNWTFDTDYLLGQGSLPAGTPFVYATTILAWQDASTDP